MSFIIKIIETETAATANETKITVLCFNAGEMKITENKNTASARKLTTLTVKRHNFPKITDAIRQTTPINANGLFIKLHQLFVKVRTAQNVKMKMFYRLPCALTAIVDYAVISNAH